jgi:hypothetical protein
MPLTVLPRLLRASRQAARGTFANTGAGRRVDARTGILVVVPAFPQVVAVGKVVLTYAGIQLGVLSVELWEHQVVVRLAGVPIDDATERREADFRKSDAAWVRAYAESSDSARPRPVHPLGADHSEGLRVLVTDATATKYRLVGGGGSGGGWNFTYAYRFEPAVPEHAPSISITLSVDGDQDASLDVPLVG